MINLIKNVALAEAFKNFKTGKQKKWQAFITN